MIVTTTSTIEGCHIEEYLFPISADSVGLSSRMAKPGGAGEEYLIELRKRSIQLLTSRGERAGADAIVAVQFQISQIVGETPHLVVSASGTAVRLSSAR